MVDEIIDPDILRTEYVTYIKSWKLLHEAGLELEQSLSTIQSTHSQKINQNGTQSPRRPDISECLSQHQPSYRMVPRTRPFPSFALYASPLSYNWHEDNSPSSPTPGKSCTKPASSSQSPRPRAAKHHSTQPPSNCSRKTQPPSTFSRISNRYGRIL